MRSTFGSLGSASLSLLRVSAHILRELVRARGLGSSDRRHALCSMHATQNGSRRNRSWNATRGLITRGKRGPMNARTFQVRDGMTHDVVTLERNQKLFAADDLMRLGRIRHLPVVDEDGALVGIVTQRDLFYSGLVKALGYGSHAVTSVLELLAIKEVMKTEVVTTTPDTPLADAARVMLAQKIGCLVVLESGKIVGILTESDFVKLYID
jgi:CBS domain-containing membrane protein